MKIEIEIKDYLEDYFDGYKNGLGRLKGTILTPAWLQRDYPLFCLEYNYDNLVLDQSEVASLLPKLIEFLNMTDFKLKNTFGSSREEDQSLTEVSL